MTRPPASRAPQDADVPPSATAYDDVAYPRVAHPLARPDGMAVLARLYGLPAPDVASAAVLELGCGDATHLICLAQAHPGARFLGVDLSSEAIARGREDVAALGLDNIVLEAADLTAWRPQPGAFGFAIAHGLYAWTPPQVREATMAVLGEALREGGLAMLSFNLAAGRHVRIMVRELLLEALPPGLPPGERMARARAALAEALDLLAPADPTGEALKAELQAWAARPPESLLHDLLAEPYVPASLPQVADHAARHGLAVLGDAQRATFRREAFPTPRDLRLRALADGDPIAAEHRQDLLSANAFRHAVLRKGPGDFPRELDQAAPGDLHATLSRRALGNVGAPGDGETAVTVRDPEGAEAVFGEPARSWLHRLEAAFPASIPVRDLTATGAERREVAHLYARFAVDLSTRPSPVAATPGDRPLALPFARLQAQAGRGVVRLDHSLAEPDSLTRRLLAELDGARTPAALAAALARDLGTPAGVLEAVVADRLAALAREGLLAEG